MPKKHTENVRKVLHFMTEKNMEIGKGNLHYAIKQGNPKKPLLIFMHCWCGNWRFWWKQLVALKDAGYPMLVPSMRGYGKSKGFKKFKLEDCAQDICHLLDHIESKKELEYSGIIIIGHSLGGMVAQILAVQCSEKPKKREPNELKLLRTELKGLMLINTCAGVESDTHLGIDPYWANLFGLRGGVVNLFNLIANMKSTIIIKGILAIPGLIFSRADNEATLRERKAIINEGAQTDLNVIRESFNSIMHLKLQDRLKSVKLPTVVVHGDDDNVVPEEYGKKLFAYLGGEHKYYRTHGFCGHMAPFEQPEFLNQIIVDFINDLVKLKKRKVEKGNQTRK